jgi:hypothetical protein
VSAAQLVLGHAGQRGTQHAGQGRVDPGVPQRAPHREVRHGASDRGIGDQSLTGARPLGRLQQLRVDPARAGAGDRGHGRDEQQHADQRAVGTVPHRDAL